MKNIAVKVHNTNKTVQQAQVVTQDGQPTVIQAQKGVNYEFLDQATGRAPHHIITKREGNDLHVSFEENGKEADLIIEDFYSYPDSGLIGLAENGQYYNYIPDTGSVQDYVTQLNVGDVEGQALGGEGFPAPWWVAGNADMNVFPWLLGLGAIGAIAAIVSDDDDNNNNVTPTPNTVILSNLSVANLSDGSNNVQITGKVQINSEDARAGTTVDITLPNGKIVPATVGDNGQYSVILSDAESLNALKQGPKVTASKDNVTDIFNLTPAPKIDPVSKQDTTVTGTAEPNSEVTVKGKAGKELGKATTDANGKWSLPVPAGTELTSGEDLTATATKAGSNPSLRDDEIVTPPKPTINPVDETSPISGTAEPNQKVEVTLPNGTTASTVSDDKGNWIVPNPGLNKGDKITAEAVVSVDGKDIKSEPQPENVIDNTPPSEPQINPVKDGDTTVSGTAEPNSKVTLTDKDGNKIGETTADDKGNWTTKVTTPLKEGDEVKATATDASGNPSQPAEQLVVDTNAPNAPDIKPIADDNKPISGTAEPNSTVTVTFPDGKTATTKADDKGNWSVPNPGLNPGDKVTATATDANGNESPKANGSVNDTTPPQQPVINGVKESDDTVTGTAEPNSTVTVTFPNGTTATVNADKDGKWSVPADPSVKDGGKITATARDNAGNTSEKAEEPIVDDLAPPAPSVNPITEGNPITGTAQPNTTITIKDKDGNTIGTATTDDKGNWSVPAHPNVKTGDEVTATATDQAGNTSSPTKEVVIDDKAPSEPSINPIKDGDTTITGTAEPNSTVNIDTNGDGTPDKTVKADDKGNFTATVDTPLKAGDKVTATATDKAGNTSKPAKEPVVDTTAPNQPDILPIDGDNKDAPIKGTAEPNSTVTVTFPDGKTATTKADDKGNWELPNPGLNTGDKVTATAKDNSGKESSPAEAVVNGDITPPAKPTVNVSDDGKTITGTAEPNSTVEIDTNGDGQPDITTKADENGNYTAPLDKPLTNGETVTARAKDPAGNISAPATDTAPDTQPTETAINDKGDTVTVTGAKPGDTVTVKDPATGETIGTGTVGNDGKATITLDKPITNGETVPVTVGTEDKPVTAPDANDTTSPDKPAAAPDMTPETDTGVNTDNITSNKTPSFVVPKPATGTPVLLVDDKEVPADVVDNKDGTVTLTPTQPLTEGDNNVSTGVKDDANNITNQSTPLKVTIDTTAPTTAPTVALADKNNNGKIPAVDVADGNTQVTVNIPADAQVGDKVTLIGKDNQPILKDGQPVSVEVTEGNKGKPVNVTVPVPVKAQDIDVSITPVITDKAGNQKQGTPVTADIDKTPSTTPDMTPETDTGVNTDNITSNKTPSFVVPKPATGTPVLLVDDKEVPADVVDNKDGTVTLTPTQPLTEGDNNVSTGVKDDANNITNQSTPLKVTIDTTAPTTAPTVALADKNNNGKIPAVDVADGNTQVTVNIPADAQVGDKVTLIGKDNQPILKDGQPVSVEVTEGNKGKPVNVTVPVKAQDIDVSITPVITDKAGNQKQGTPVTADIDKTPSTTPDMTPETDTGVNTDNITSNKTPSFVVPKPATGTPVLLVDDKEVPADVVDNKDGTVTLTPTQPLTEGDNNVSTGVKDDANNITNQSTPLKVTIDTTAPTTAPTVALADKNNNGKIPAVDVADGNTQVTVNIPADAQVGDKITLIGKDNQPILKDGQPVSVEVTEGNKGKPVNVTVPVKAQDIDVSITPVITDKAGNQKQGTPVTADIDKTPSTTPDMTPETDTGVNTDNITSNKTPSFVVPKPATGTPVLLVDDKEVPADVVDNKDGTVTLTPTQPLTEGDNNVSTGVKDDANNITNQSTPLKVTIDTTAPTTAPTVALADKNNNGKIPAVDVADGNTQVTVNIPADAQVGDKVTLIGKDNQPILKDGQPVSVEVTEGNKGKPVNVTVPVKAQDIDVSITPVITDKAGNQKQGTPVTADIDKTPSTTPDMTPETDTGVNTDNITSNKTPSFVVPKPATGTPVLLVDDKEVPADVVDNKDGTVTLTPTQPLTEGDNNVSTGVKDDANNITNQSTPLKVTIDTTAPTTAPTVALADKNNNGKIPAVDVADGNTQVTVNIPADAQVGDKVTLIGKDNQPILKDGQPVSVEVTEGNKGKPVNVTVPVKAQDIDVSITPVITDKAGNQKQGTPVTADIDKTPSTTPDMTPETDTGVNTDNITSNKTPSFVVPKPATGTPVLLVDDKEVPADVVDNKDGTVTLTPTQPLTEGDNNVSTGVKDDANNITNQSTPLKVTIDTTAPTTAPTVALADKNNNGKIPAVDVADGNTQVTVNIPADAQVGDKVTLIGKDNQPILKDGQPVSVEVTEGNKGKPVNVTVPVKAQDIDVSITPVITDKAGNQKQGTPVTADIDKTPSTTPDMTPETDTGVNTDNITSNKTPSFVVPKPATGTPVLLVDDKEVPADVVDNKDGTVTLTPTQPLTEGDNNVSTGVKDDANNITNQSTPLKVTIDTTAPTTAPTVALADKNNNGKIPAVDVADGNTQVTVNIPADAQVGDKVTLIGKDNQPILKDGQPVSVEVTEGNKGKPVNVTVPVKAQDIDVSITPVITDKAGNQKQGTPVTADIDKTPSTTPDMTPETDTGVNTDNITSNKTPSFVVPKPATGTPVLLVDDKEVPADVVDNKDGTVTLTPTQPLTEGDNNVSTGVKDDANNITNQSTPLKVTIDTTAPTTAPTVALADKNNNGKIPAVDVADGNTQVTVNIPADAQVGDKVTLIGKDNQPILKDGQPVSVEVTEGNKGKPVNVTVPVKAQDIDVSITPVITDKAGNQKQGTPVTADIDKTPSTTPDMTPETDTGVNTDNITSNKTPSFVVPKPATGTPVLLVDDKEVPADVVDNKDGTVTLTPTQPLTEGDNNVSTGVKDDANNITNQSTPLKVTIDTTAPTTAPTVALADKNNNGKIPAVDVADGNTQVTVNIPADAQVGDKITLIGKDNQPILKDGQPVSVEVTEGNKGKPVNVTVPVKAQDIDVSITPVITDKAGNQKQGTPVTADIDKTPSTTPDMTPETDTGVNTDNITSNKTPSFVVPKPATGTPVLLVDDKEVPADVVDNKDGTVTLTPTQPLTEGDNNVSTGVKDDANNITNQSTPLKVTIDTTAPTTAPTVALADKNNNGKIPAVDVADGNTQVTVNIPADAQVGDKVTLIGKDNQPILKDGQPVSVEVTEGNKGKPVNVTVPVKAQDIDVSITPVITDKAGNQKQGTPVTADIDKTPSTTPDMTPETDTGVNTDNITSNKTPSFVVPKPATGTPVLLVDDKEVPADVVDNKDGTVTLTPTQPLTEGDNNVSTGVKDDANNITNQSTPLKVTIDTTAPTTAPTVALADKNNNGKIPAVDVADGNTQVTVNIPADAQVGDKVTLIGKDNQPILKDGQPVSVEVTEGNKGKPVNVTVPVKAQDIDVSITPVITDKAGNQKQGTPVTADIDKTPSTTPDMTPETDTGVNTDNITSNKTPSFVVPKPATGTPVLLVDDKEVPADVVDNKDGTVTLTPTQPLTEGDNNVSTGVKDDANNITNQSTPLKVTIDTTAPTTAPTVALADKNNNGKIPAVDVADGNTQVTVNIPADAQVGDKVTLIGKDNQPILKDGQPVSVEVTEGNKGKPVNVTVPVKAQDIDVSITPVITDKAGNQKQGTPVTADIDKTPSTTPDMTPETDTGVNTDNITSNKTPSFVVPKPATGTPVLLVDDKEVPADVVDNKDGTVTLTPTQPLTEGDNNVSTGVKDDANNITNQSTPLKVTIDTTAPTTAPTVALADKNNNGKIPAVDVADGNTQVTVNIPADAQVGDKVTLIGKDNQPILKDGQPVSVEVTEGNKGKPVNVTVPVKAQDIDVSITPVITDKAGNQKQGTPVTADIDKTPSTTPDMTPETDTGVNTDNITSNKTPSFVVPKPATGTPVLLVDDKEVPADVVDNKDGTVTLTPTQPLTEGDNNVSTGVKDDANNITNQSTPLKVTIDTTAPTTAPTVALADKNNNGKIPAVDVADGNTQVTVNIPADAQVGDKVTLIGKDNQPILKDGQPVSVEVTEGNKGKPVNVTVPVKAQDIDVSITPVITDKAGNQKQGTPVTADIDKTPSTTPDMTPETDTGVNTDNITSNKTPSFVVPKPATGTPVLLVDDKEVPADVVDNKDGTVTLTPTQPLTEGDNNVSTGVKDDANNITNQSTPLKVTIDTTAPTTAPTVALADKNNNGKIPAVDVADGNTQVTVNIPADAQVGDKITLIGKDNQPILKDGQPVSVEVTEGNKGKPVNVTVPVKAQDIDVSITPVITDKAGNQKQGTPVTADIDKTPSTTPDMTPETDTGVNTDNITSNKTPSFVVPKPATGTPVLLVDDKEVPADVVDNKDGTVTLTPTQPLTEGDNNVSTGVKDDANNITNQSTPLKVTIDTTAPTTAPTVALADKNNNGKIPAVDVADGNTQVTVNIPADAQVGDKVTLIGKDNQPILKDGQPVSVEVTEGNKGKPVNVTVPVKAQDIDVSITPVITDKAGNQKQGTPVTADIDKTPSTTPDMTPETDTGVNTDNITSNKTPSFVVPKPATGTPVLLVDDKEVPADVVDNKDGTVTLTPTQPLTEGDNNVSTGVKDDANNITNQSTPLKVTIDTTAPTTAPTVALADKNNNGKIPAVDVADGNTQVTVNIPADAQVGDKVTLIGKDNQPILKDGQPVSVEVTEGNKGKPVNVTVPVKAQDIDVSITPVITDKAGNQKQGTPVTADIDKTPSTTPDMTPETDTGVNTDNITSNKTPSFVVPKPATGTPVLLVDDKEVPADVVDNKDGTVTLTPTQPLTEGDNNVSTGVKDDANNITNQSTPLKVTIDTTAPTTAPTVALADKNNNGKIPAVDVADGNTQVTVNIPADAQVGDKVTLIGKDNQPILKDGQPVSVEVTEGNKGKPVNVTVPVKAQDIDVSITPVITDKAGNQKQGTPVTADIDKTPSTTPDMTPETDTGVNTDNITSNKTPSFVVPKPATGTPVLLVDDKEVPADVVDNKDGTVTLTPTQPLTEGDNNVSTGVKDDANNITNQSTPLKVTIDTTAPSEPKLTVTTDNVDGQGNPITEPTKLETVTANSSTNDPTPTFSGTGTAGDTITVTLTPTDGKDPVTVTTKVGQDGNWSVTPNSNLPEGTYNMTVTATDKAGNTSGQKTGPSFTVDTTKPDAPTILLTDTNLTAGETSNVTITFTEPVTGFTKDDVTVENGKLSQLTSNDGGKTWTGTFTPTANVNDPTNVMTIGTGYTDLAGNASAGQKQSDNYVVNTVVSDIDNVPPTVVVSVDGRSSKTAADIEGAVEAGEIKTVTFKFTDNRATAITGFDESDITVTNGSLVRGSLQQVKDKPMEYTATVMVGANTSEQLVVFVASGKFSDGKNNNADGKTDNATIEDWNNAVQLTVTKPVPVKITKLTISDNKNENNENVVEKTDTAYGVKKQTDTQYTGDFAISEGDKTGSGRTNDTTPTITVTLDKALAGGEKVQLIRYTKDPLTNDLVLDKTFNNAAKADMKKDGETNTYTFTDMIADKTTTGKDYVYKASIVNAKAEEVAEKQVGMTLDTVAEQVIVTGYDSGTKTLTGNSTDIGATIFVDNNGDGIFTDGDDFGVVDKNGEWKITLTQKQPQDNQSAKSSSWNYDAKGHDVPIAISMVDRVGNQPSPSVISDLYVFTRKESLYLDGGGTLTPTDVPVDSKGNIITNSVKDKNWYWSDLTKDGEKNYGLSWENAQIDNQIIYTNNITTQSPTKGREFDIYLGKGDDILSVNDGITSAINIDMGAGNDYLYTKNAIGNGNGTGDENYAYIYMGEGDDIVNAGNADNAKIYLGEGNDKLFLNELIGYSTVTGGAGDDLVRIAGEGKAVSLKDNSSIDVGEGNDTVVISKQIEKGSTINLGTGNDVFHYGASDIGGKVDAGEGYDKFILFNTNSQNNTLYADDMFGFEYLDISGEQNYNNTLKVSHHIFEQGNYENRNIAGQQFKDMLLDGDRSGSNLEIWTEGNTGKWKKTDTFVDKDGNAVTKDKDNEFTLGGNTGRKVIGKEVDRDTVYYYANEAGEATTERYEGNIYQVHTMNEDTNRLLVDLDINSKII